MRNNYVLIFRKSNLKELSANKLKLRCPNAAIMESPESNKILFVQGCLLEDIIDLPIQKKIIGRDRCKVVGSKNPDLLIIY